MLTSVIYPAPKSGDPMMFMVGTKLFKGGDEIPLNEEEQSELNDICDIFRRWNILRTDLLNKVHLAEEPFVEELANAAHDMKILNFDLRYRLNLLISAIEKRYGGLLPIFFSSTAKKLFVSHKPEESLVYTVKFISDTIGMPAFDFPRTIASAIVGKKNVYFDNDRDEIASCISAFGTVTAEDAKKWQEINRIETLVNAIESSVIENGSIAMSLIVLWGEHEIRIINSDAIPATVDPNTRAMWNLKNILSEVRANAISLVIEKAEQATLTFSISHLEKDEPVTAAEIAFALHPIRHTTTNLESAQGNFAITRMTNDDINKLLV